MNHRNNQRKLSDCLEEKAESHGDDEPTPEQSDIKEEEKDVATDKGNNEQAPPAAAAASKRKRKRKRSSNKNKNNTGSKEIEDENDDQKEANNHNVKEQDIHQNKSAQVDRTVFVEGIPYTCTEQEVRDFFAQHLGGGSDSNKNNDNNSSTDSIVVDVRLPVWPDTGRLRGYGHVVLASVELQQAAVQLSGKHYLQNRYLTIQPAKAPKDEHGAGGATTTGSSNNGMIPQGPPSKIILLQNLSYDAQEEDIDQVLSKYGPIVPGGIRVVRHNATRRSRGFAYVEFASLDSAQRAASDAAHLRILGRPCRVDYDHGTVQKSLRTSTGRLWQKQYKKAATTKQTKDAASQKTRTTTNQPNKRPRKDG